MKSNRHYRRALFNFPIFLLSKRIQCEILEELTLDQSDEMLIIFYQGKIVKFSQRSRKGIKS